uniref:Uncharacterized protein n=1 Tax=Corethron hystrix TaxID=216773 RepID=A0A7S1BVX8_9STRA|mmetsp:Transcript_43195/g.101281  ORF Transcript_43195/g.101281 Transcript_43195/m.101281 type:complete len:1163 (+) Transcript_43195:3349-6837(+)
MFFYEYIRPPCVEVPFSNKLISIRQWWPLNSMCLDKNIDYIAREVCVPNGWDGGFNRCRFSEEKISFAGAKKRCENEKYPYGDKSSMDDWKWAEPNGEFGDTPECGVWNEEYWQWAKADCTVSVKVNEDGNIAVVHDPDLSFANEDREGTEDYFKVHSLVDSDNNNFFSVNWTNDKYPKPSNACAGSNCDIVAGSCHCDVNVVSTPVFTQSSLPTGPDDVIAKLKIGSFHPDWYDTTPGSTYIFDSIVNSVSIYHQDGGTDFDVKTIFSIEFRGETRFYKNIASSIELVVGGYKFRNPPYFVNWAIPQKQQMIYETEAVLDTYFYHNNVAPFLSNLIIKRFGISNPSPRYIKVAASAFKTGSFLFNESMKFGSGKYGDLGAMLAAIVLDREALSPVLDSDPTYGSLKEPLLKFIKLMRSMEFVPNAEMPQIKLEHIDQKLNQMPYRYPNVFSFFLPDYSPSGPLSLASLTGPEAQILTTPTIISFLNGMISLIDIGLHECFGGFGRTIDWWCDYNEKEWFEEDSQSSGHLNFSPSDPNDASIIVNELSLLLTNDRLNDDSKTKIIKQVKKAMKDTDDSNAGLRLAQKLIVSTPEFQSQNQMKFSGANRPDFEQPTPSEKEYKAIVYIFLDGGADSFNMLAPYTCSNGLYESYQLERGSISLSKEELLEINSNNPDQPCSVFGLHPRFNQLQNLYNKGEVLFAANIGVLTEFVTKDDWYLKHDGQTQLFAHNVQAEEIQKVDIFNEQAGKGMLGRLLDILSSKGHKTNAISVHGESNVLVGNTPVIFVDSSGVEKFNPIPWSDDIEPVIKDLNNGMTSTSGLFGETWSRLLYKALGENKILFEALKDADPTESFPETHLGEQLLTVSKLMKIRNIRGSDRDSFYVSIGGFDNHSNLKSEFDNRVAEIDEALGVFAAEMDVQNTWNSVAVVVVSEFARTLTPNSGQGSDHAWGGNYFIAGGLVNGGKVIGDYPTDFSLKSPLNIDRGRLIPTRSWDSLWNGIVEWFGASERIELDTVLPNRANFQSVLFSKADMFRSPVVSVKGKIEFKLSKMMSNIDESISLAVVNVAKGKLEDLLGKKKLKKKVKARFVDLEISWLKSSFNESKKVMKIECEIRLEYAEEPKVSSLAKEIKKSMKKDVARFKDLGEEFKKMKKNITTLKVEN